MIGRTRPEEIKVLARLEAARWPAGPVCPACNARSTAVTRVGNTSRQHGVLKCNRCGLRFNVRTGTPLAHSHIPLDQWLSAIDLYQAGRPRGKAAQISRALNVTYKTAWSMVRRISAMQGSHTWLTREVAARRLGPTFSEPSGNGQPVENLSNPASRAKTAILDAAERIISSHGLTGLSIRSVAKEANVAHAAISYYFGPKAALLHEVFRRRREPLLAESNSLLDACLKQAPDGVPTTDALIRALLTPSISLYAHVDSARASIIANFQVRMFSTTEAKHLQREYDATRTRFVDALCKAAPHLKRGDVVWRYHMLLGCLYYTAAVRHGPLSSRRRARSPKARAALAEEWINQIVSFVAWGFGVGTQIQGVSDQVSMRPGASEYVKPRRARRAHLSSEGR